MKNVCHRMPSSFRPIRFSIPSQNRDHRQLDPRDKRPITIIITTITTTFPVVKRWRLGTRQIDTRQK
jgi:hypothetical protein